MEQAADATIVSGRAEERFGCVAARKPRHDVPFGGLHPRLLKFGAIRGLEKTWKPRFLRRHLGRETDLSGYFLYGFYALRADLYAAAMDLTLG